MRVISGKYKGHSLTSFNASHIRPTTDRVKETLFNILMGYIGDARILDLFCGTGNLGIESISRGAKEVVFVDSHIKSVQILKKNLEILKVTEPYSIYKKDVFSFLKSYQGDGFDVIFADPPFTEKIAHDVMERMAQSQVIKDSTLVAIESGRHEKIEDDYGSLIRYDTREFGDKVLSFFRSKMGG